MVVIVGLGNPGKKYENTRHNMGFKAIDQLSEKWQIPVEKSKHQALVGEGRLRGEKVILVKPQTFMNQSGISVKSIVDYYQVPLEKLLIIYDDLDLSLGTVRIRKNGGAGTHNGMRSVVNHLGEKTFPRIRIGIGNREEVSMIQFVIGKVNKEEKEILNRTIEKAAEAVEVLLDQGIDKAMNRYNGNH